MKIISSLSEDTQDGISTTLDLEKFDDNSQDEILFYGLNCINNKTIKNKYKNYNCKVLLNLWTPCEYTVPDTESGNAFEQVEYFDEVYQICPWTTEWMNKRVGNKFKFIWHPFSTDYTPNNNNKIYDVCYHGGLHGPIHYDCINKIKQFKYRFISQQFYPEVTNYNVSYKTKLDILAQCKINIVYNYIPLREDHISNIKKYVNYEDNIAFKHIDKLKIIPQKKMRFDEACLSKTLNLVHKDPWNIIEHFYKPNEDFYYFNSNEELLYMINNILKTWDHHKSVIESAYKKCFNYNAESTYNFIKDNKCI